MHLINGFCFSESIDIDSVVILYPGGIGSKIVPLGSQSPLDYSLILRVFLHSLLLSLQKWNFLFKYKINEVMI